MEQNLICPRCRNSFIVTLSGKPGVYGPTCPICGYNFRVKLKHPSDGYVKVVERSKPLKQLGLAILIIGIILILVITIIAFTGGLTPKGTADVWITNCLNDSTSYELYIDEKLYKSGVLEPNETKKYEIKLIPGEHTITLKAAGLERVQKQNIEAGKEAWISFMIYGQYVEIQIPIYG